MSSALGWRSTALLPWSCRADAIASAAAALVAAADKGAVPDGADDDADDDADAVPDDADDGADAVLGAVVFLFLAAASSIPNGLFIEEGMVQRECSTDRLCTCTEIECQTEKRSRAAPSRWLKCPHKAA